MPIERCHRLTRTGAGAGTSSTRTPALTVASHQDSTTRFNHRPGALAIQRPAPGTIAVCVLIRRVPFAELRQSVPARRSPGSVRYPAPVQWQLPPRISCSSALSLWWFSDALRTLRSPAYSRRTLRGKAPSDMIVPWCSIRGCLPCRRRSGKYAVRDSTTVISGRGP